MNYKKKIKKKMKKKPINPFIMRWQVVNKKKLKDLVSLLKEKIIQILVQIQILKQIYDKLNFKNLN